MHSKLLILGLVLLLSIPGGTQFTPPPKMNNNIAPIHNKAQFDTQKMNGLPPANVKVSKKYIIFSNSS